MAAVGAGAGFDSGRDVAVDAEVGMEPPAAVRATLSVAHERGVDDGFERPDRAAVDGDQRVCQLAATDVTDSLTSAARDLMMPQSRWGSKTSTASDSDPSADRAQSELALHIRERAGLPQRSEDWVEEEE